MSKSTGNFYTIKEVISEFSPEVLRLFLLSSHYLNQLDFNFENLIDHLSDDMYLIFLPAGTTLSATRALLASRGN